MKSKWDERADGQACDRANCVEARASAHVWMQKLEKTAEFCLHIKANYVHTRSHTIVVAVLLIPALAFPLFISVQDGTRVSLNSF